MLSAMPKNPGGGFLVFPGILKRGTALCLVAQNAQESHPDVPLAFLAEPCLRPSRGPSAAWRMSAPFRFLPQ